MNTCAYCGHPLRTCRCDDCDGWRGDWWLTTEGEYLWEPCAKCEGTGTLDVCPNLHCHLDGKDHLMLVDQRARRTA